MASLELKEWYEKNRSFDLNQSRTRSALKRLLREEKFLSPKAREALFDHFITKEVQMTGLLGPLPKHITRTKWGLRDTRTGRFTKLKKVKFK